MESIKEVLIRRDSMTEDDADELIAQAKDALIEYVNSGDMNSAEEICAEYFGLEPDYLEELMLV